MEKVSIQDISLLLSTMIFLVKDFNINFLNILIKIFIRKNIGEWLRCDDHIIEQTTFETVKTSDAYILVYSRCMPNSVSSPIQTNPSGSNLRIKNIK